MSKAHKLAVYILRGQPFHNAHLDTIKIAATIADKVLIILGSAQESRTLKNPFTVSERKAMVIDAIQTIDIKADFYTDHTRDYLYDDNEWADGIKELAHNLEEDDSNIVLVGHDKDESTFYMTMFKDWHLHAIDNLHNQLNASDIRELYFDDKDHFHIIEKLVPQTTLSFLKEFKDSEGYNSVMDFKQFIADFKKPYAELPYGILFNTVDLVITCKNKVVLITRGNHPFKGKLALMGGFINEGERSIRACLRECKEETGLIVSESQIKGHHVFEHPKRDPRGHFTTFAYWIELESEMAVVGQDDAVHADYYDIDQLTPEMVAGDHWDIIQHFLKSVSYTHLTLPTKRIV